MLHCQQCGAGNAEDARFCNQCGEKIARTGERGGPLVSSTADPTMHGHSGGPRHEATPQPKKKAKTKTKSKEQPAPMASPAPLDVSTVSLSTIGVRSRSTAWLVIIGLAALLIGVGGLATWLGMRSMPAEEVAQNDQLPPEDPEIEVGDPVPQGEDPPGVDIITGTPRPSRNGRTPTTTRPRTNDRPEATPRTPTTPRSPTTPTTGNTNPGNTNPTRPSTDPTSPTTDPSTLPDPDPGTDPTNPATNDPGTGTTDPNRPQPNWDELEETAPEDPEMDEYAMRVRSLVRTYYATRAQSCFEHETRNEQTVRGTVVIGFDIEASGAATHATVVRNTTGIATLGQCLARQVQSWRFPQPPDAPLSMQIPFSR